MESQISFGGYSIPVIIAVSLGIIYKIAGDKLTDEVKAMIPVLIGIAFGILSIPYRGLPFTIVSVVDNVLYGLMAGASAIGLYKVQRAIWKPAKRPPVSINK